MLLLISPAKSIDFSKHANGQHSIPRLLTNSERLVKILKTKSPRSLKKLMSVSDEIAELNHHRFQEFSTPFTTENAKEAVYAFTGDVYRGLEALTLNKNEIKFAQKHLRILSGLYGLLKPLDLIQAYRLEMGTRIKVASKKNLYAFWDSKITDLLNEDLEEQGDDIIINLASNEYFKAIKQKGLKGRLYHVNFRELRKGEYKFISFSAKVARGMMCKYVIQNRLTDPQQIKNFDLDGYKFNKDLSSENEFIFTKKVDVK